MLGGRNSETYSIIHNGVNKNLFFPNTSRKNIKDEIIFCTTGNFRNLDMIEPIIKALDSIHNIKFKLKIAGPVSNPILSNLFERTYIDYLGAKTLEEVSNILRQSDIFPAAFSLLYVHFPLNRLTAKKHIDTITSMLVFFNTLHVSFLLCPKQ